jgi:hypothetical protein
MEYCVGLVKAIITEEIWPGRGLNPGLQNDTLALCPLLHDLILNSWLLFVNKRRAELVKYNRFELDGWPLVSLRLGIRLARPNNFYTSEKRKYITFSVCSVEFQVVEYQNVEILLRTSTILNPS